MKIYKDSKGIYWVGNVTATSGDYRLKHNEVTGRLSIFPFDTNETPLINPIYDVLPSELQKEDDSFYADFEDFYSSMHGLFRSMYDGYTYDPKIPYSADVDTGGKQSLNSVFGDKIIGHRVPSIAAQFQYGVQDGESVTEVNTTGSVGFNDNMLELSTGTDSAGSAIMYSTDNIRYIPGHELYVFFTAIFTSPEVNSYQRAGLFDAEDGFYIGYEDDVFTFSRRRGGVDYHYPIDLTEFNKRIQVGLPDYELDPTKGNIYKISFGYLGFATISLDVMLPGGTIVSVAKIPYPNNYTETHITQTYLPVRAEVANTGNTSNIVFNTASLAAGIVDGYSDSVTGRAFSWYNPSTFTFVTPNYTIVSFRNKSTYKGIDNKVVARLLYVSGANSANKTLRWHIVKGTTFTNAGSETWQDVDTNNSILEYSLDTLADFNDLGTPTFVWNTAKEDSFVEHVEDLTLDLKPGEVATFVIQSDSTNTELDLSIRWRELF